MDHSSDNLVQAALSRNFSVAAYLGYVDIILKNNGNDFHESVSAGKAKGISLKEGD